jgi:protein ImuB
MTDPARGGGGEGSRTSLCLWLPTFELRLELVRAPELDATSVALLSPGETAGRREILQVSERAARAGVQPGMLVSRAVSLCPSLTLLEPDPAHYDAATEQILEVLSGLSPVVQPVDRGLFHVGVDGLERLYGSPASQVDRILHALLEVLPTPLVAAVRAGRAPGTFGARVSAASARPGAPVLVDEAGLTRFLAPRPIFALPLPPDALARLDRLGVATLGELGRIPAAALLRQFGPAGPESRSLARGERIDPVRPLHRPRPIRASLELPAPVSEVETLHRALDRLLERTLGRPERKDRAVRSLRLGGHLEGGGSWTVDATLREPSARREALAFPLRSRIRLAPPPRALETLFVEFFEFGAPTHQTLLFDRREEGARGADRSPLSSGRISESLREAVRELESKLGHSPLYRVVEVDPWSRLPERRYALLALEP